MRISSRDKIQALIRNPHYRADYEEYLSKTRHDPDDPPRIVVSKIKGPQVIAPIFSKKGRTLCQKCDIPYPVNPDDKKLIDFLLEHPEQFLSGYKRAIYLPPWNLTDKGAIIHDRDPQGLKKGYLIPMLVDARQPRKIILKEFEAILQRLVKPPKQRHKETIQDIWQVWDMHHEEGKTLLQITKELFGITKMPFLDHRSDSRYRQVRRAYNKAKKIIQSVSPSHK